MSEEKKCSKDNRCSDCQDWLKEKLASCEDWETKRKESYQKFELRFCSNQSSNRDRKDDGIIDPPKQNWYVETGGYNYNWERCSHCNKVIKTIKSNDCGDSTVESEDSSHDCKVDHQIKSNQIKSNQIKSNQTVDNSSNQNKSYLPYILGGIGIISLIGIIVYFLTRKIKKLKNND